MKDFFDIADAIIEEAYPDIYNKGRGWWGAKRIPNWGILRGAIVKRLRQIETCDCGRKLSPGLCGICDNDE